MMTGLFEGSDSDPPPNPGSFKQYAGGTTVQWNSLRTEIKQDAFQIPVPRRTSCETW